MLCQLSYIGRLTAREGLERETGIEPATNSLEGCDSTTELLPPSRLTRVALRRFDGQARHARNSACFPRPDRTRLGLPTVTRHASEGWWGGEGSNLRSPKAAGLQPAAIDRSATSPISLWSKDRLTRGPVPRVLRPSKSFCVWSLYVRRVKRPSSI